jgi:hypothetical protein
VQQEAGLSIEMLGQLQSNFNSICERLKGLQASFDAVTTTNVPSVLNLAKLNAASSKPSTGLPSPRLTGMSTPREDLKHEILS